MFVNATPFNQPGTVGTTVSMNHPDPAPEVHAKRSTSISRVIASFASELRYEQLPASLVEFLKDHIIDVVGTSIAATRFDFAHRALSGLSALADRERSSVIGMAQKVEHAPDPKSAFPEYFSGGVEVTLGNGRTITHHDRVNRGAGERALNRDDISRKFQENAEFGMSRPRAEEMLQVLLGLERYRGREIAQALSAWRPLNG